MTVIKRMQKTEPTHKTILYRFNVCVKATHLARERVMAA